MFARASKEIDAKRKFDATRTRVEEDGAIVGTCAGSNPGDAYEVRVRVRGKDETSRSSRRRAATDDATDDGCSVVNAHETHETHETHVVEVVEVVEVSCTCPAARTQAFRRDAQETRLGAAAAPAPPRAQPPRSCKHSTALLLWRARTLAAVADPDASVDEPTDVFHSDDARGETHERTTRELREGPGPARPAPAPPPRPAVPPAKKRRLPPSLAQSAAAAAEAAAGRAKRPPGEKPSQPPREDPKTAARERGKGKEKETFLRGAAPVAVKREPGLVGAAAAGDAGENAPAPGTTTKHSGVSLSRADREVVAKAQTIGDAALLDAARRAMRGAARGAAEGAAEAPASRAARDDALSAARGAPEPQPRAPSPRSQKSAAPAMKDMFASFLPAAFKAPTGAAASAPAPAPAGDSSLEILETTRPAGTARPVSIAEPAVLPAVAPSVGGAVSTGAGGEAPAVEGAKGGPKKMSFAELMASGGL